MPRASADMLWQGFELHLAIAQQPGFETVSGAPSAVIDPWHLPLINTILLVTSSFTLTFAHHALKHEQAHGAVKVWLALTVLLGASLPRCCRLRNTCEAYTELGLTLGSGIYGATFFMLTGFHGAHVTIGALMLTIMLIRMHARAISPRKNTLAFEAASLVLALCRCGLAGIVYLCLRALRQSGWQNLPAGLTR